MFSEEFFEGIILMVNLAVACWHSIKNTNLESTISFCLEKLYVKTPHV